MMDALSAKLPESLLLFDELPSNLDAKLSRLFIPMLVAIEVYDDTAGEEVVHLSDAYYKLGKYSQHL